MRYHITYLLTILLIISSCTAPAQDSYTLGVLVPLSGPPAFAGESYLAGLQKATDEINAAGGVQGKKIALLVEDNKGTAADAVTAFRKLESSDIDLLVSTTSASSVAVAPLAKESGIPTLFSVIYADVLSTNDNAVVFFPTVKEDAETTVEDMNSNGVKTAAIVYLNSEYGLASLKAFKAAAEAKGISVVSEEAFTTETEVTTSLLKIKEAKPDALYLAAINVLPVLNAIQSQDHPPLYLNLISAYGGLIAKSPQSFEGVHYTTSEVTVSGTKTNMEFSAKLSNPNVGLGYASLGYDNMLAIAAVLEKNENPKEFVNTFTNLGTLSGINGEYNIDSREEGMELVPRVHSN